MSRDITLQMQWNDLAGDETYELWLLHESDGWLLDQTGDVVPDIDNLQDFIISTLIEGDNYSAQMRAKRAGRYRAGYLTADPETWPSISRVDFVPGALVGVGAPVINSAVWERTSSSATDITLSINADNVNKNLKIYRDGVAITTLIAPFVNPITYVDPDPVTGVNHEYTARHTVGFLDGAFSAPVDCFAGPLPPTGVTQTSSTTDFGSYTIGWSAGGADVQVQDDFVCAGTFANQGGLTTASSYHRFVEIDLSPDHGTQDAIFQARVRAEITTFSVTDITDWVTIPVECLIYDDNTEFNSCP